MPALPKTSSAEVLTAARKLIAKRGLEALSMQAVAAEVGVSAPALYKRFTDRAALVAAVVDQQVAELHALQSNAATTGSASGDLKAIAMAQRAYAHKHPNLYALIFGGAAKAAEISQERNSALVEILLDRLRRHGRKGETLEGARLLTAFTHGFLSMELSGAFRLGGDTSRAFVFGVDQILAALAR